MIARTSRCLRLGLLVAVFLASASLASAYTITLNPDRALRELVTRATDQSVGSGGATDFVYPAALPYAYASISVEGDNSAESEYDLSNAGFNITFNHSRDVGYQDYAQSYETIRFSVDQDVNYSATGSYFAVDPDGRRVTVRAYLRDVALESDLFFAYQGSWLIPNESFTLGLAEGNRDNINTGSLTGTMIAGREYEY